jgi:pSer/pThr/pTyr-binding forkhead associated (FHA) protein/Mg-chelatase subunit ChlD
MRKSKIVTFLMFAIILFIHSIALADIQKDIVLVLDNSGSMKQNDPQFLTKKVVSDFLTGLSSNTQVGIVLFDEKADLTVPLSPVGTGGTKKNILDSLLKVNYAGKLTDSPAGVERAIYELKSKGRKDATKVIVFITDGLVDTGDKARDVERAKWLREDLVAECQRLGIRIFGIAFTEQADFQLIQALGQKTNGGYFRALKADEIEKIFKEIDKAILRPPADTSIHTAVAVKEGGSKTWLIVIVLGMIVLGIVAIAIGRGKKESAGVSARPVKMPKTSLKDIREITGKHEYPIKTSIISIGRAATNDIVINKSTVSTKHATIEYRDNAFYIIDQRSTNGTFLNGQKITTEIRLKHGDRIKLDEYEFIFTLEELADETKTQLRGAEVDRAVSPQGKEADDEKTKVKDMCPNHPAWKATELCLICKTAYCEKCMVESVGTKVCSKCTKEIKKRGLT